MIFWLQISIVTLDNFWYYLLLFGTYIFVLDSKQYYIIFILIILSTMPTCVLLDSFLSVTHMYSLTSLRVVHENLLSCIYMKTFIKKQEYLTDINCITGRTAKQTPLLKLSAVACCRRQAINQWLIILSFEVLLTGFAVNFMYD